MIQFRHHNLLDGMATLGRFDLILCRNVLIYFDPATKAKTLEGITACLNPDASLILGSAETVVGLAGAFEPTPGLRGVFRVKTGQRAAADLQGAAMTRAEPALGPRHAWVTGLQ